MFLARPGFVPTLPRIKACSLLHLMMLVVEFDYQTKFPLYWSGQMRLKLAA